MRCEVDQNFYEGQHWWRVEVELKRNRTDDWIHSFDQLHLVKPNWKNIEKNTDRAMVFMLLSDDTEWANLDYYFLNYNSSSIINPSFDSINPFFL